MAYAPLDDQLNVNAKILGLTHEEFRLWVAGLAWTYQHNRKGAHVIPAHIAEGLAGMHRIGRAAKVIAGLVAKRAWETVDGGYQPHDVDKHDHRDRLSETRAAAGAKGGRVTQARRKQNAEQTTEQKQAHVWSPEPVPVPVPLATSVANAPEAREARGPLAENEYARAWEAALPPGTYGTPSEWATIAADTDEALEFGAPPDAVMRAVRSLAAQGRTRSLSVELRKLAASNPYSEVDRLNAGIGTGGE